MAATTPVPIDDLQRQHARGLRFAGLTAVPAGYAELRLRVLCERLADHARVDLVDVRISVQAQAEVPPSEIELLQDPADDCIGQRVLTAVPLLTLRGDGGAALIGRNRDVVADDSVDAQG